MEAPPIPHTQLPTRTKFLYGLGDWSMSAATTARTIFWLFFLANVAGVDVGLASIAAAVGRIWDAVNDPLIGIMSDKLETRWGRRRPFLLFFAIPFGITFFLLFWLPPIESKVWLAIYYAGIFILFDTVYTLINVPYVSLAPALTEDYDERSSLAGWRAAMQIVASLITAAGFKSLAEGVFTTAFNGDRAAGYALAAALWGVSLVIPPMLIFAGIDEPKQSAPTHTISFWQTLKEVFQNRPFLLAAIIYLCTFTAVDLTASVLVWFLNFYVQTTPGFDSVVLAVMLLVAMLTMPLNVKIMHRYGKRKAYIGFTIYWMLTMVFVYQIPPGGQNMALIAGILSGLGYGAAIALPWAIVADVIEYDELETGIRREGAYSGFFVFLRKLAGAAAIFAVGQLLEQSNFIENTNTQIAISQPATALKALRFLTSGAPLILLFIALIAAWRFPLNRLNHEDIRLALAQKRLERSGDN